MTYFQRKASLNNMERNQGVAVLKFDASDRTEPRGEAIIPVSDGDIFVLGRLPNKSLIRSIILDLTRAFPAGHTLDVVRFEVDEAKQTVIGADVIASGVILDTAGMIHIPLATTGNLNADGTPYVGANPVLKASAVNNSLGIIVYGADTTDGSLKLITNYDYFDTKGTGVYLS